VARLLTLMRSSHIRIVAPNTPMAIARVSTTSVVAVGRAPRDFSNRLVGHPTRSPQLARVAFREHIPTDAASSGNGMPRSYFLSRSRRVLCIAGTAFCAGCATGHSKPAAASHGLPDPDLIGAFSDDYGNNFRISATLFEQLPRARFHIVEWHAADRFLIAHNDASNPGDAGLWTRIDWVPLDGMAPFTWGFCMSAFRAATQDAARTAPEPNIRFRE
jgi:hypothetical protein